MVTSNDIEHQDATAGLPNAIQRAQHWHRDSVDWFTATMTWPLIASLLLLHQFTSPIPRLVTNPIAAPVIVIVCHLLLIVCTRHTGPWGFVFYDRASSTRWHRAFQFLGVGFAAFVLYAGSRIAVENFLNLFAGVDLEAVSYNSRSITNASALEALLTGVIDAALGEELLYRVAIFAAATRLTNWKYGVVAQAVLFGFNHTGGALGYSWPAVGGLIAGGAAIGVCVLWTRSIWPAVIAHALGNLIVTGREYPVLDDIAMLVLGLLMFGFVGWVIHRPKT